MAVLAPSAVAGLTRSDPRDPGITRMHVAGRFTYRDPAGAEIADGALLERIRALALPPAWRAVWISPDPLGHIQATGVDSRGRTQYRYHQLWREQRDAQKFEHMLLFASALPAPRAAATRDLGRRQLDRDRVTAGAVRLIDLGLFRIGGERYAELDHHYGVATLQKRHVAVHREGVPDVECHRADGIAAGEHRPGRVPPGGQPRRGRGRPRRGRMAG
jgi:DNA topoisomerase-1